MPATGRAILYAKPCNVANAEKIVIAPLKIGDTEVITVDYLINSESPMEFESVGAPVTFVISGNVFTGSELAVTRRAK